MAKPDLITAIATAPGLGAVGVVRLSGPDLQTLFGPLLGREPQPRRAQLVDFLDAKGDAIDQGLVVYFPAPHSYTGEHVLELQGHGGPAVLQRLLRRCLELGARLADPGEFTRRAFLNDKLDLAQAEGVADLIEARSEAAARAALRSLKGEFSAKVGQLVDDLIALRLLVEAHLDFPEEGIQDLDEGARRERLAQLTERVAQLEQAAQRGSLLRDGISVVLIGRPNVGKSSLLNRLAGEEVAIVTHYPGTTRDIIRQELVLDGVPVQILDTAGMREPADPIEGLGIERARRAIEQGDLALIVADIRDGLTPEDHRILGELPAAMRRLVVFNKIDLVGVVPATAVDGEVGRAVTVSALTGAGIDTLRQEILGAAGWGPAEEGTFLARERHLRALRRAAVHLECGLGQCREPELLAEELRLAQLAMAEITGAFSADDLLGEIFARFCIGK